MFFKKKSVYDTQVSLYTPQGHFNINSEDIESGIRIMKKNGIKKLSINPTYFKTGDIQFIEKCNFIEDLNIYTNIQDYFPIHSLNNLKSLTLQCVVKQELHFNFFPKLESCYFIWNSYMQGILEVPTLKHLQILKYTGSDFSDFRSLSNLKSLELDKSKLENSNGLIYLKQLEKLDLFGSNKLKDLQGIEQCEKLEILRLEACHSLETFDYIADVPNLKMLGFSNIGEIISILPLIRAHNLVDITFIEKTNVLNGDLSCLKKLYDYYSLRWAIYMNRDHYSHKREELNKGGNRMEYIKSLYAKYTF